MNRPTEAERYAGDAAVYAITGVSKVSKPTRALTRQNDTSDTMDTVREGKVLDDEELLAGVRDGAWLDAQIFPALRYAVPGLIPEGFTILVGPPKAGKSWLMLGVLLAVAAGGYAIGHIPTGPRRRVLYLALEDGDRRMQERCRALLGDAPIPPLFHYLTKIPPGRVLDVIRAFLRRHPDTALVVIDTLGKVMPPAVPGESAYQRDYRVGGALKDIADQNDGLAVVVLHHDRKATSEDFVDSVSGTHGLAGAADTIIVLARKRQQREGLLMVTGRDVTEAEYALTVEDGAWTLDGQSLEDAAERARQREETGGMSDTSIQILEFVRQHPDGVRSKEVAERFGDNAPRYLQRLEEKGWLIKLKRGVYAAPEKIPFPED
ncbi:AAA family ATPase [Thermostaphylospora chromogena]|uniref:AAA domain-containing protein n=1 Tax=Thermostaphylospora chromogena TaxID=35622 RepID=A0A1H1FCD3_9ACTN|nr:AAA family ATPase [Thermostaphylospora chromogena]SDQ98577.1 AAA domain-containing protein [Thermostaphylospora chromogena]